MSIDIGVAGRRLTSAQSIFHVMKIHDTLKIEVRRPAVPEQDGWKDLKREPGGSTWTAGCGPAHCEQLRAPRLPAQGEAMSKIVLLTSDKPLSRTVAHALQQRFGDVAILAVPRRSPVASVGDRVRRLGVTKAAGQLLLLGAYGPLATLLAGPRRRSILASHQLDSSPLPPSKVHNVPSVNSGETIALLQRLAPDVVVVFHTPIISDRVLKSVKAPFINLHGGITPAYRGNYAAYWALVNLEDQYCGVTIHLIDKGIDTGDIISQLRTRPTSHDNFFTYQFFQTAKGMPLLLQAVEDTLNGSLHTYRRNAEPSRCWTTPTLFEYLWNGWRSGVW